MESSKDLEVEEDKGFKEEPIKNEKILVRVKDNHKHEDDEAETH